MASSIHTRHPREHCRVVGESGWLVKRGEPPQSSPGFLRARASSKSIGGQHFATSDSWRRQRLIVPQ